MQRQRLGRNRPESNGQKCERKQQNEDVREHLLSHAADTRKQVCIHISQQEHELEEKNAGGPDGRRPAQIRKKHLADHRLTNEKEERAGKERPSQNENTKSIDQLLMEPGNQQGLSEEDRKSTRLNSSH